MFSELRFRHFERGGDARKLVVTAWSTKSATATSFHESI